MDYKYIEQLLERYFSAETTLEEESILRSFFSQADLPEGLRQWRALFTADAEDGQLGDDFDSRILSMIEADQAPAQPTVRARRVALAQQLRPLFKAAAVVAIIITIGGALQAPWDNSWNTPDEYALQQQMDTLNITPIQAENIVASGTDSTAVLPIEQLSKD